MNAQEIEIEENEFDEYLDDCFDQVQIGVCTFDSSYVLKERDPAAYNIAFADYSSEHQRYICDECGEEFDDFDEAEECCQEDPPELKEINER